MPVAANNGQAIQGNAYRVKEDSLRVNWNKCEF